MSLPCSNYGVGETGISCKLYEFFISDAIKKGEILYNTYIPNRCEDLRSPLHQKCTIDYLSIH